MSRQPDAFRQAIRRQEIRARLPMEFPLASWPRAPAVPGSRRVCRRDRDGNGTSRTM